MLKKKKTKKKANLIVLKNFLLAIIKLAFLKIFYLIFLIILKVQLAFPVLSIL